MGHARSLHHSTSTIRPYSTSVTTRYNRDTEQVRDSVHGQGMRSDEVHNATDFLATTSAPNSSPTSPTCPTPNPSMSLYQFDSLHSLSGILHVATICLDRMYASADNRVIFVVTNGALPESSMSGNGRQRRKTDVSEVDGAKIGGRGGAGGAQSSEFVFDMPCFSALDESVEAVLSRGARVHVVHLSDALSSTTTSCLHYPLGYIPNLQLTRYVARRCDGRVFTPSQLRLCASTALLDAHCLLRASILSKVSSCVDQTGIGKRRNLAVLTRYDLIAANDGAVGDIVAMLLHWRHRQGFACESTQAVRFIRTKNKNPVVQGEVRGGLQGGGRVAVSCAYHRRIRVVLACEWRCFVHLVYELVWSVPNARLSPRTPCTAPKCCRRLCVVLRLRTGRDGMVYRGSDLLHTLESVVRLMAKGDRMCAGMRTRMGEKEGTHDAQHPIMRLSWRIPRSYPGLPARYFSQLLVPHHHLSHATYFSNCQDPLRQAPAVLGLSPLGLAMTLEVQKSQEIGLDKLRVPHVAHSVPRLAAGTRFGQALLYGMMKTESWCWKFDETRTRHVAKTMSQILRMVVDERLRDLFYLVYATDGQSHSPSPSYGFAQSIQVFSSRHPDAPRLSCCVQYMISRSAPLEFTVDVWMEGHRGYVQLDLDQGKYWLNTDDVFAWLCARLSSQDRRVIATVASFDRLCSLVSHAPSAAPVHEDDAYTPFLAQDEHVVPGQHTAYPSYLSVRALLDSCRPVVDEHTEHDVGLAQNLPSREPSDSYRAMTQRTCLLSTYGRAALLRVARVPAADELEEQEYREDLPFWNYKCCHSLVVKALRRGCELIPGRVFVHRWTYQEPANVLLDDDHELQMPSAIPKESSERNIDNVSEETLSDDVFDRSLLMADQNEDSDVVESSEADQSDDEDQIQRLVFFVLEKVQEPSKESIRAASTTLPSPFESVRLKSGPHFGSPLQVASRRVSISMKELDLLQASEHSQRSARLRTSIDDIEENYVHDSEDSDMDSDGLEGDVAEDVEDSDILSSPAERSDSSIVVPDVDKVQGMCTQWFQKLYQVLSSGASIDDAFEEISNDNGNLFVDDLFVAANANFETLSATQRGDGRTPSGVRLMAYILDRRSLHVKDAAVPIPLLGSDFDVTIDSEGAHNLTGNMASFARMGSLDTSLWDSRIEWLNDFTISNLWESVRPPR